jgi:hypothetical protein
MLDKYVSFLNGTNRRNKKQRETDGENDGGGREREREGT